MVASSPGRFLTGCHGRVAGRQISTDQHRNFPADELMSPLPVCRVWQGVDDAAAPFLGPQRRPYAPRADGRIWNKTRCNVQLTAR
jgi:hypothetical protein